jgi:hypothetical protein
MIAAIAAPRLCSGHLFQVGRILSYVYEKYA